MEAKGNAANYILIWGWNIEFRLFKDVAWFKPVLDLLPRVWKHLQPHEPPQAAQTYKQCHSDSSKLPQSQDGYQYILSRASRHFNLSTQKKAQSHRHRAQLGSLSFWQVHRKSSQKYRLEEVQSATDEGGSGW